MLNNERLICWHWITGNEPVVMDLEIGVSSLVTLRSVLIATAISLIELLVDW